MTTFILFLVILISLVMIHELGHFLAAKLFKMRVEEFAFGFPPKLFSKKIGETEYVINLLPIGGYVKISGESFDEEERKKNKEDKKSFHNKSKIAQIIVLMAGIIMNLLLAISIFTYLNMSSRYISINDTNYSFYIKNPKILITNVLPNSPSKTAGLEVGDQILEFKTSFSKADLTSENNIIDFIKKNNDSDITIVFKKINNKVSTSTVHAVYGISKDKKSIGIKIIYGEKVSLNIIDSLLKSISDTNKYTKETFLGYANLFKKLFSGNNVMDSMSGPVGIAKMVGVYAEDGINSLLIFVALLSINLAVFNALPLPALDGGRIIFVIYEAVTRRKININFQYYTNLLGFIFLIGLMLVVTFFDIFK